jgi:hypothetical protein
MFVNELWRTDFFVELLSDGQVTLIQYQLYFSSGTSKSNSQLLIRYPFKVTVSLQLLVTVISEVTKPLLIATRSNQLRGRTVTPLHFLAPFGINIFSSKKSNGVPSFRKEWNEFLKIR